MLMKNSLRADAHLWERNTQKEYDRPDKEK